MQQQQGRDIGLIGLGVMGRNLALNIDSRGFRVSVWDQSEQAVVRCVASQPEGRFLGCANLMELVASLARPRKVWLMVNAGAPVDEVLARLLPLLERDDIVIDGGNSLFKDTERRAAQCEALGLRFVGSGVSGGEEGARKGPALMPGGPASAWAELRPVFEAIAARAEGQPCVVHIGPGGAGHYVKMVHNGIEYADMQLIGETYALMAAAGLDSNAMARAFTQWNGGELRSYLIDITARILAQRDPETGAPMVDLIQDRAGQKGTGQWTLINAAESAVVVSAMGAAVDARVLSSMKAARVAASSQLAGPAGRIEGVDPAAWVALLHDALYASKIVSYAQGFDLLRSASQQRGWALDLGAIAGIWRGGCIIRAAFLGRITEAYTSAHPPANLLLAPDFVQALARTQAAWREVIATAVRAGVAVPAMSAALAYYDAYRTARGPANLLQAQRDFFGAHTYERVDRPAGEMFHTEWPQVQD
ncbi:MAG: NADP-dependent phosphogluconate dehydrogenase [Pseudomonadota bacterium]|jgi:6-phosphogluconate dehydrogenase